MTKLKAHWSSQQQAFDEAIQYMRDRKSGKVSSLITPFKWMNVATMDGIEWQSMVVIGGRPATGKTAVKDQIIREAFYLNPHTRMSVLEFSLEMVGRITALRSFSAFTGKTYPELLSTHGHTVTPELIHQCEQIAEEAVKNPIYIVEKPPTIARFELIVHEYMKSRMYEENGVNKYENVIITIDHSLLMLQAKNQTKNDMLYELGATITKLKRQYPVIFLVLSQLNRAIDHPDRNEDGKYGNYVLDSDIFGADALLQHADLVLGLNRPGKQKIRYYGPERYIIPDENMLVIHHLKARQGKTGLTFYNCDFSKMAITDVPIPPKDGGFGI